MYLLCVDVPIVCTYCPVLSSLKCCVPVLSQNCYNTIQKEAEESNMDQRWKKRRKTKKQTEMKLSAETRMVLGQLFVVLNFIYADNFKFVDDYR